MVVKEAENGGGPSRQRTVVSCPLTRITENSIGFSDLPELPYTGRITDMEVRMVRLGCFAERFSEALIVGIWTNIADQSVFIVTLEPPLRARIEGKTGMF